MNTNPAPEPPAVRDPDASHPIAGAWRDMLTGVVHCLVGGDYSLEAGVSGVEPISAATAQQIRSYIAGYGATLIGLPGDTWQSSVAQWYGTYWDVLVDLWTAEEGPSDLVLSGRISETDTGPRLTVHMVYVP